MRSRVVRAAVGSRGLATGFRMMRKCSGRAVMLDEGVRDIRTTRVFPTRRLIGMLTMTFVRSFRNPFRVTVRCVAMRVSGRERDLSVMMPLYSPDRTVAVMRDVILSVPSGGAVAA